MYVFKYTGANAIQKQYRARSITGAHFINMVGNSIHYTEWDENTSIPKLQYCRQNFPNIMV